MIGTTVSHYTIVAKLGEGGMGIVYKAQDTKLDRFVALKFLPPRASENPETKARFLQEAKAAAALNHPDICTIHGVEEHEGVMFIVMEYMEGGTLRDAITKGELSLDNSIRLGIEIGEALQEAHSKGIVHRDIKSDNIMLTGRGQAKVMDFGLAKLKGSLKLTRSTSTVGTLAYMAPEQIQGGDADTRSDIFSFGVLLFEMLTGKLPFRGEHEAAMMYSILNEAPDSIQTHLPNASAELLHIINRALEKDPEDRYQSVADMTSELRRLLRQSSRIGRPSAAEIPVPSAASHREMTMGQIESVKPPQNQRKRILLFGGLGLLVVVVISVILLHPWQSSAELNANLSTRLLEIPFVDIRYPGLSADGNWAAFPARDAGGRWHLYFMNTGGGEPRAITADSFNVINSADVSSDGGRVVFDAVSPGRTTVDVLVTSALGGGSRVVAQSAFLPRWEPDGKRIFFTRGIYSNTISKSRKLEIWSVEPEGANERMEFIDSISVSGRLSLSLSPDNRSLAWIRTFTQGGSQELFVRDLASGTERQLTFDKKNIDEVCWAPNNQIIFSSNKSGNTNLWMIPSGGGTEVQITKGTGPDLGMKISADSKKLLYYQNQFTSDFWVGSMVTGVAQQITFDDRIKVQPALSPDGTLIAFVTGSSDPLKASSSVVVTNRDGNNRRQITSNEEKGVQPRWSPDGRSIAYTVARTDTVGYIKGYVSDIGKPGTPKFIGNGVAFMWMNQQNLLLLVPSPPRTLMASVETGEIKQFFQDSTSAFPVSGGKYVCYRDLRRGREGRWVVEVNASFEQKGTPRKILGPVDALISPRADCLVYQKSPGELWSVSLPSGKEKKIPGSFPGFTFGGNSSLNPDTKEIIYTKVRSQGKLVMIENLFK